MILRGGVTYFLWNRDHNGPCTIQTHYVDGHQDKTIRFLKEGDVNVFIRDATLLSIYNKVKSQPNNSSFAAIVSPLKPYGLRGEVFTNPEKYGLPPFSETEFPNSLKVYGLIKLKREVRYISKNDPHLEDKMGNINYYKVFLPESNGTGAIGEVLSTPIIGTPNSICTETFLSIGKFNTEEEAKNCESYIKTKFFRAMLNIKKITQHNTKETFELVPDQDFSHPWTDQELYEKYKLSQEEIDYIEKYIEAMN